MCTNIKWSLGECFSDETPLNGDIYASLTVTFPESPLMAPLPPRFATQDWYPDRDQMATLIVGRCRQSRDQSFSILWGAVGVKLDIEIYIDIKGQE